MKKLEEIWEDLFKKGFITDKGNVHSYISIYEDILMPFREKAKNVLEIGLFNGDSMRMWENYFLSANVYGIDCSETPHGGLADLRHMINSKEHKIYIFDAENENDVKKFFQDLKFDVIIEDANHSVQQQLKLYNIFKNYLATDGIYIIEDIEDIDNTIDTFLKIDDEKNIFIIDNRKIKNRFDDVLVVITQKKN